MKRDTTIYWNHTRAKFFILICLCISFSSILDAQVITPLSKRKELTLKGDFTFLSNTVLGKINNDQKSDPFNPNNSYNKGGINNQFQMGYIDIDNDPKTFNSSSATLQFDSNCIQIKHVGLYWTAVYADSIRKHDISSVRIKLPNDSTYMQLKNALILHDGMNNQLSTAKAYTCYKDITHLITQQKDPNGIYTVANIASSTSQSNTSKEIGNELAGGWTMVVIYEDPNKSRKRFYVYDGYVNVSSKSDPVVFNFDGFKTIPKGIVKSKLGIISYEGDKGIQGDALEMFSNAENTYKYLHTLNNPKLNFFNSSITKNGSHILSRQPASQNTLGYDADIFDIKNNENQLITNNQTQTSFRLSTKNDGFVTTAVAFSIEVYEPTLDIVKSIHTIEHNEISSSHQILPGEELLYTLTVTNNGNDDAVHTTIQEVFPSFIELDPNTVSLPKNSRIDYQFDTIKNQITFKIPNKLLKHNSRAFKISYKIRVTDNCSLLTNNPSIDLSASSVTATYKGAKNTSLKNAIAYNDYSTCHLPLSNRTKMDLIIDTTSCETPLVDQNPDLFYTSLDDDQTQSIFPGKTHVENNTLRDLIDLNTIYFDFDHWKITPKAKKELDKIVTLMRDDFPNMIIKIETHTDQRGSTAYNQKLSQKRASSIYYYLTANQIESKRIISYVGMGESKPIIDCQDQNCTEAQFEKNRRSNFIIVAQ